LKNNRTVCLCHEREARYTDAQSRIHKPQSRKARLWLVNFKLLYILNHFNYFNEICRIYCVTPHITTESLTLIHITTAEVFRLFLEDCFSIGAPCIAQFRVNCTSFCRDTHALRILRLSCEFVYPSVCNDC